MTTIQCKITLHDTGSQLELGADHPNTLLHATFGRMNPTTSAHIELLSAMERAARASDSSKAVLYLSNTQNIENPLTVHERTTLISPMIHSEFVQIDNACNLFNAMSKADELAQTIGASGIVWWIGSDRLHAAQRLLLYPDHWKTPVVQIAELTRAADDTRSATAMRAAALNSDYETFERLAGVTPTAIPALFDHLRIILTNGSVEGKTKTAK